MTPILPRLLFAASLSFAAGAAHAIETYSYDCRLATGVDKVPDTLLDRRAPADLAPFDAAFPNARHFSGEGKSGKIAAGRGDDMAWSIYVSPTGVLAAPRVDVNVSLNVDWGSKDQPQFHGYPGITRRMFDGRLGVLSTDKATPPDGQLSYCLITRN